VMATRARMLPPPPPPPPVPSTIQVGETSVEVPAAAEHVSRHHGERFSPGSDVHSRCTISSLQQFSSQVIDELKDLLVTRLRSSCVASSSGSVVASGDRLVVHSIRETHVAGADVIMGSGASAAAPSSPGSSSSAMPSQMSSQAPLAHSLYPSTGRSRAEGAGGHSVSLWQ
jgi:hypothetical protein